MPPPAESFARLFRRLDPAERRGFVADLWAARGWETEATERGFLAVRGDAERRVRVTDPGRFGTPTLGDTDVLVTARDRPAVRAAAREAGVRYVSPSDLREMLLYAIDREAAAALFAATFDRPLESETTVTPAGLGGLTLRGKEAGRAVSERLGGSRAGLSLLLALLLVGVAVAGPVLGPGVSESRTETLDTVTFTPDEAGAVGVADEGETTDAAPADTSLLPGVEESGVSNLSTLVRAHREGVRNRKRTLRVFAEGPPNATFMAGRVAWNYTVRVERAAHYRFVARYTYPDGTLPSAGDGPVTEEIDVYASSGVNYRRQREPTETSYLRYPTDAAGDAGKFAGEVSRYIRTYLRGQRSAVDCVGQSPAVESFVCRVVVTGAPERFPEAESYRATAVIRDDGIVVSFVVGYTLPDADGDGEREAVRLGFAYDSFGETTVSEPDWLSTAKNATGE